MQKLLIVLVLVLLVAGLFIEESLSPRYRLRASMPPQFLDSSGSLTGEKRVAEEKIARAYWDCAVNEIQWRYGYGYRLPDEPPSDFVVAQVDSAFQDSATRTRYWHTLQRVWYVPENWTKSYQWDTQWLNDSADSIRRFTHFN